LNDRYALENTASRQQLGALIARLSEAELRLPLASGWSISAVLAHLAFWDQRALVLLHRWQAQGIGPSLVDVDAINDATLVLCAALPPHAAAGLALSSAAAIDQEIDNLPDGFLVEVEAGGPAVRLDRSQHRREHLQQIEQALERG
jgi:hypothetical protein